MMLNVKEYFTDNDHLTVNGLSACANLLNLRHLDLLECLFLNMHHDDLVVAFTLLIQIKSLALPSNSNQQQQ